MSEQLANADLRKVPYVYVPSKTAVSVHLEIVF